MNIVLIGMPGCGKSTVGVLLAKLLGYEFADTDILLQKREGALLQDIIDTLGDAAFLEKEDSLLRTLCFENTVIATGGSAPYSETGMKNICKDALCVYIYAPVPLLEKRLTNLSTRGVAGAKGKSILELYDLRAPLYERYADITVDACDDVLQCAKSIVSALEKKRK